MPGSLLSPPQSRVSRHESTRSDQSDGSNTSQSSNAGKKVSFNKAVRVKKYTRPKKVVVENGVQNGGSSPEKRFWFRVYKNKHRESPDHKELKNNGVIYYHNDVNDDSAISYHPNPSPLNYPVLTSDSGTQTLIRDTSNTGNNYSVGDRFTTLHPSQMPTELPQVKRDHVKKIVNRFNEESFLTHPKYLDSLVDMSPAVSPMISPRHHSTPIHTQRIPTPPPEPTYHTSSRRYTDSVSTPSKSKKNPIVNGVKVMFGMGQLKKKDKAPDYYDSKNGDGDYRSFGTDDVTDFSSPVRDSYPYKTEIVVPDSSKTDQRFSREKNYNDNFIPRSTDLVKSTRGGLFRHDEDGSYRDYQDFYPEDQQEDENSRRGKFHVETWDSGNQLVFDTSDVNTASTKLDNGELFCTVGEKHQLWQNNKRMIVYEQPSPKIIRRKAKSQGDLSTSHDENGHKSETTEHFHSHQGNYELKDNPKKSSDSWLKLWRTSTKDKGIQCNKVPTIDEADEEIYSRKYRFIKPSFATAYSNAPQLEKINNRNSDQTDGIEDYNPSPVPSSYRNGDIYSQVDKSKKKKFGFQKNLFRSGHGTGSLFKSRSEPLYIGPPPKSYQHFNDDQLNGYDDLESERKVKTSKRSFGFRLNAGRDNAGRKGFRSDRPVYSDENWYDVDDEVEASQGLKNGNRQHHDISEVRQEMADDEYVSDHSSTGEHRRNGEAPGSVMREVDYKKREISYENVHRHDADANIRVGSSIGSNLWFRDADEDYRKEMAQSEVSYPAGNHVGSERFYTLNRTEKKVKDKPPSSPRALTLDRRHFQDNKKSVNPSGVRILVNGKEISDKSSEKKSNRGRKNREDPSSVQSDPMYVRGGLAAAYQARQRAAVRRSNSSVAGIGRDYRAVSPVNRRRYRGTSEASAVSSETESAHARRPLVMYIPGISHKDKSPESSRSSAVTRTQSMMSSSRPAKIGSKSSKSHKNSKADLYRNNNVEFYEEDEIMPLASDINRKKPPKVPYDSKKNGDIKRRHSMPKDTKFSWLKWKIKGKPSREP